MPNMRSGDKTLNRPSSTAAMVTVLPNVPLTPPGLPPKPTRNTAASANATARQTVSPPPIQQSQSTSSSSSLPSPGEDAAVKLPRSALPSAARMKGRRGKYARVVRKNQDRPQPQNNDTVHMDYSAFEQHNSLVRSCVTSPEPTSIRVKVPLPAPCPPSPAKTSSLPRVPPPELERQLPPYSRQPGTCVDWVRGKCDRSACRLSANSDTPNQLSPAWIG
ncbi:hypothetical protein EDD16DRAFT_214132 [Pisolithus croceorrhizus]|nr:hypothetical protein EDD16DRAFT_214132 [Pisolithus croceorrhizus]